MFINLWKKLKSSERSFHKIRKIKDSYCFVCEMYLLVIT